VTLAVVALVLLSDNDLLRSSFALDHVTKLVIFVVLIESLSRLLVGLERLAGFDTTPIVQNMFLARTVAEFWRRYNRRVHDWFEVNVFRPGGGRRAPVRAVVLVFLVSALFHEVMFDVALSRIDGYQFAFFALQIPAVLASGWLERLARRGGLVGKVVAHGVAILWMVSTSVFFFRGVHRIFPVVYVSEPWLP
jgi:D-alanyl-lipoteichoic acid acyltransferase DltB (MBOAT superfamily)